MGKEVKKKYKLRYEEELLPLMDAINSAYIPTTSSDVVFRSTISQPPSLIDSIPQSKRENVEGIPEESIILTDEEVGLLTDAEKKEYIGEKAISVFKSREKCLKDIQNIVNHIADKYSLDEAQAYLLKSRGPYMVKLQLSEEVGLIEKKFNKKGHKNVLLNEGICINNYIIEDFPPLDFRELLNEKNLTRYNASKESYTKEHADE